VIDEGPRPIPPATHTGEPPTPEEPPDTRISEMLLAFANVGVFVVVGAIVQLFTHEGVICLVAGGIFAVAYQLALFVQRLGR
jgi:hypothetical protein